MVRKSEVAQLRPILCDPMDCSPPGSSVHGIFQARVLEWIAISFSRGSSDPGIESGSPALQADALPSEPPEKPIIGQGDQLNSQDSNGATKENYGFVPRIWGV